MTCTVDNIVSNGPDKHLNDPLFDENGSLNPNLADSVIPLDIVPVNIQLDSSVEHFGEDGVTYRNFVGGDEWDYAEVTISQGGKLKLELDVTGTAKQTTRLVLYKLTLKANGTWAKSTVTTVSARTVLDATLGTGVGYGTRTTVIKDNAITKVEGKTGDIRYFVGIRAGNAKKGTEAYYTACATLEVAPAPETDGMASALPMPETASVASALAMPETDNMDALADSSLNLTDSLSFGGYDTDALADASASALAELDDKSAWMNLASLA